MSVTAAVYAQIRTANIPVRATIGNVSSITAAITRVTVGNPSVYEPASEINFGQLQLDNTYRIFRSLYYFFVDVGINTNAANWTVTHNAESVTGPGGSNLDNHINVSFVRQITNTSAANLTNGYVSYANSNGKYYTKNDLQNGWLRIYYGIATGSGDNSGVTPISQNKTPGNYSGSVYLTLTPQ
ncbi:MAG: hypothetical protein N2606_07470 [Candidatus Omnitrophica bacterium]|nr:hypothetical protein [Candidatus Omnitrophota bacterium]